MAAEAAADRGGGGGGGRSRTLRRRRWRWRRREEAEARRVKSTDLCLHEDLCGRGATLFRAVLRERRLRSLKRHGFGLGVPLAPVCQPLKVRCRLLWILLSWRRI